MARRLYLGRLPPDARSEDVAKFFEGYGRIVDCRVMTGSSQRRRGNPDEPGLNTPPTTGFGFVEFESSKDAEDAVHSCNGKPFMGQQIVVEFAKESRPRREPYENDRAPRSRRPPGIRLIVSGVSRDTSWQDLKDFGREAGSVSFADIDRDASGEGVLEYLTREDAERAVKELDGRDLRGRPVRVEYYDPRGGPDNYRRDDRRDPRDDRHDDRYGGERDRYYRDDRASYRRDRSRSPPPRRDAGDRRPRSPPPRKGEEEHRRPSGDEPEARRSSREERRRDDKDERYEERSSRANGDGGWSR